MKKRLGRLVLFCLIATAGIALWVGCAPAKESPLPASPPIVAATPEVPAMPVSPAPAAAAPPPAMQPAVAAPQASPSAFPLTIKDELGRTVTITKAPQRIISLAPSNTEILFALGLGDKVIAVTDYDDFPAAVKQKTSVGGYTTPNMEKIVSLSPDLILVTSAHTSKVIQVLEGQYTVVGLDPQTIDDVLKSISLVGKITGKNQEASDLTSNLQTRINAVTDKTSKLDAAQRPRTFYIVWDNPLMSAGAATFQADLIEKAGGSNVARTLDGWATISPEAVLASNPQVMIAGKVANMGDNNFQFIKTDARLANTDARKQSKVYEVDGNLISRPGPRLVDALEEFARTLHPELFGPK